MSRGTPRGTAAQCLGVLAAVAAIAGVHATASPAAPWCGSPSGRDRPPAVTGRTIRVVYAYPSDGADRTAELAPRISADVDEVVAWWRTQDAEREPRFDVAAFSCGLQADILTLRLTDTAATLARAGARFERIVDAVEAATGRSGYVKHLVYYDGPTDDDDTCGQGSGGADGPGLAIVYLEACSDIPKAAVAAHELLHALGALASNGPPNACPETRGHACDGELDLLYPYAGPASLGSLVLDVGRNDYYGHAGSWLDAQDSGWLRLVTRQVSLALGIVGEGSVESDIPGVDCSASCTSDWDAGTSLSLVALAGAGQRFVRWSGACSGSLRCDVTLSRAAEVGALFAPDRFRLVLSVAGKGAITGAAAACRLARCTRQATSHVRLRLRATAAKGWRFAGWAGACRGRSGLCTVPMAKATAVRARFVPR